MGCKIDLEPYSEEIIGNYSSGKLSSVELADKFNCCPNRVRNFLREKEVIRKPGVFNRKYSLNENYFEKIDTPNKAYFLGLVCADGYINRDGDGRYKLDIALQERDGYLLDEFRKDLNYTGGFIARKKPKGRKAQDMVRLKITSRSLVEPLEEIGLVNNKCKRGFKADCVPDELFSHFVRGYFDGDGSISVGRTVWISFTSCNEDLLDKLNDVFPIPPFEKRCVKEDIRVYNGKLYDGCFSLRYSGPCARAVLKYMYKNKTVYMKRKFERYQEYLRSRKYNTRDYY